MCQATLPHSGIRVAAPSALFVRANGDAGNRDPVEPDVPVAEEAADPRTDPALDAARSWIRGRAAAP